MELWQYLQCWQYNCYMTVVSYPLPAVSLIGFAHQIIQIMSCQLTPLALVRACYDTQSDWLHVQCRLLDSNRSCGNRFRRYPFSHAGRGSVRLAGPPTAAECPPGPPYPSPHLQYERRELETRIQFVYVLS